ncbi:MAG: hypothetical protein AB1585_17290 [Thermodesulfobacteriota bacterium]
MRNRGRKGVFSRSLLLGLCLCFFPSLGQAAFHLQVRVLPSGEILWERPLAVSEPIILMHRNSIYGVTVRETLQLKENGALWLVRIQSPSPAVLEYYGLEAATADWIDLCRRIGSLQVLVTSAGEFRLEFTNEAFPLSQRVAEGSRIEIRAVPHVRGP